MENGTASRIARAARLLLEKEGADAVTMRRVAGAVRITPMAIYRHYPDREALLRHLADEGFNALAERLSALSQKQKKQSPRRAETAKPLSQERRLLRMLDLYLDHALENPRLFELMFLKPREGARRFPEDFEAGLSPTGNPMASLIEEGMHTGFLRKDDAWEIVFAMGALFQGLVLLYLGGRISLAPAAFRDFCRRSFRRYLHGIRQ